MRLNNRGFAISTIMYMILIMAIILITLTLTLLSSRKLILDKTKQEAKEIIYSVIEETVPEESILPEEYQQVVYLESTGTQYIDMQYTYKINDKINIEFMIKKETGAIQGVFGNGNSYSSGYKGVSVYIQPTLNIATTIGGLLGKDWYKSSTAMALNEKYNIQIEKNQLYLNNQLIITVENELGDGTQTDFSLFRRWGTNGMYGRIYSFSVERDSKLIFNLIPCYRKSDNVVGMYDIVNDVFYTNAGTGEFVIGPKKR